MRPIRQVLLRPIGDPDTDLLVAWRNAPESRTWFRDSREITAEGHRGWLSMPQRRLELNSILEVDGVPSAFGSIYAVDRRARSAELGRFLVDPRRRGQGLGRLLCTAIVEQSFDLPYLDEVRLEVKFDNVVAIALYRSLGFHPPASEDEDAQYPRFVLRRREWAKSREAT